MDMPLRDLPVARFLRFPEYEDLRFSLVRELDDANGIMLAMMNWDCYVLPFDTAPAWAIRQYGGPWYVVGGTGIADITMRGDAAGTTPGSVGPNPGHRVPHHFLVRNGWIIDPPRNV